MVEQSLSEISESEADAATADNLGIPTLVTNTLMTNDEVKRVLADSVLEFARSLSARSG